MSFEIQSFNAIYVWNILNCNLQEAENNENAKKAFKFTWKKIKILKKGDLFSDSRLDWHVLLECKSQINRIGEYVGSKVSRIAKRSKIQKLVA